MKARYQKLLEMIALGLQNASDAKAYDAVVAEAQLLGVATKMEISGVRAMASVELRSGPKSPATCPFVYRHVRMKTEKALRAP